MADVSLATLREQLDGLREAGAARFAPARFRYLESLSERLGQTRLDSRRSVERLAASLAAFQQDMDHQRQQAQQALADREAPAPELEARLENGEFAAVLRQLRRPATPLADTFAPLHACYNQQGPSEQEDAERDPLSALLRSQEQSLLPKDAPEPPTGPARRELKALRQVRANQQKQRKTRRIDDAITRTPSDAGPLNSHRLVTRAIATLRELSPAYLDRFVSHVDTLMWLEKLKR
ncbi:MAG: DUF2894 domain-containing protein [Pseudomonadales bacterium]|nr:DUF2894 domain-containing protein [Pseudomonadales bacterium]